MRRRLLPLALLALLALAPAAHASGPGDLANWDRGDQRTVMRTGLLAPLADGRFHGDHLLTRAQLTTARNALAGRLGLPPVAAAAGGGHVSVFSFDRFMVDQLGLSDVASIVQHAAFHAGLDPPRDFGSEVVARYLGLRFNHPYPLGESIELYPWQAITRAEAAYSLARVAGFDGWEAQDARATLSTFTLPRYTAAQRQALRIAVSKIGMPYIWGGETDGPSSGQVHGGYDCSGFAWRVYKVSGLPAGQKILGRTAAQQAGEIPRSQRIHLQDVQPGDLLFFGPGKFWQRATESRIVHEGIALSRDWAIHSSSEGVYVLPLTSGWLHDSFVWARRVL